MARDKQHFLLQNLGKGQVFKPKGGGSKKRPADVPDRAAHAQALLSALNLLPDPKTQERRGLYLEIAGRSAEPMVTSGLDASGLTLLKTNTAIQPPTATVYATPAGLEKLRKKITEFETRDRERDGKIGRPFNADLVQSIATIVEAGLRALWRSPPERFPDSDEAVPWELWLDKAEGNYFIATAPKLGVQISTDRLEFPEDIVVIAVANREVLATAIRKLGRVRAIAAPSVTAEFFDAMPIEQQAEWMQALNRLAAQISENDASRVTILDTGIARTNPLIAPALSVEDRHAAEPGWGVEDSHGHGTQLAGLAIYGDLTYALQGTAAIVARTRLESSKIIPDAGHNPHHLLGAVTRAGINAVEAAASRRRTFALATTTVDDTPHDGAPTSWSSELDQLAAGVSGQALNPRLVVVSAGNTAQQLFSNTDYLATLHLPENEIESPAQAWNVISVGAHTEKVTLPAGDSGVPFAPFGDASPSSRTASWKSHWPLKPDVVLEGGNWVVDGPPPPMRHTALGLLTTDHTYPARVFTGCSDTSAATALAAGAISQLWSEYPDLWPETVRALFVMSARWTPAMRSHLPAKPQKLDYEKLFQRYGFGVPDMERARRSASNAITLVVQDTITPYAKSKTAPHKHHEMKVFSLPWPVEALRELGTTKVTMRVALSTFAHPNPSEPARGSKFSYASHNLRFKLNRPDELRDAFLARISKSIDQPEAGVVDQSDGWTFGRNRRDVGSLQIDELLPCNASDLARRNLLAVHPVSGWWKMDRTTDPVNRVARFALIIEIDAGETLSDLYAEVANKVAALNPALVV